MSALREFYANVVGVNKPKGPMPTSDAKGDGKGIDQKTETEELKAEIMKRLAALVGPYKDAVTRNGPDVPKLKELFEVVKAAAGKRQFAQAAQALDALEQLLAQRRPNTASPSLKVPAPLQAVGAPGAPTPAAPANASIKITPEQPTILAGGELRFSAIDSISGKNVATEVDWTAEPKDVISIDSDGLATGQVAVYSPTTATITARDRVTGATAELKVTVTPGGQPERMGEKPMQKYDLAPLRADLKGALDAVSTALHAEKAMKDLAAKAGVDLNKPDAAVACMKKAMSPQDKNNLKDSAKHADQARRDMVNFLHDMQDTTNELRSVQQGILPDKLPPDLEKKVDEVGKWVARLWPIASAFVGFLNPVVPTQKVGDVMLKDKFKGLSDEAKAQAKKFEQHRDAINQLIDALDDATKRKISDLNVRLLKKSNSFATATEKYAEYLGGYAELIDGLSGKGSCPPEYGKTYAAIVAAAQMSKTAQAALITKTLAKDKYKASLNQLDPLGSLIVNAPTTPEHGGVNLIVYEKGGKHYGYNATHAQIERIVEQLKMVKQLYDSADSMEGIAKTWNEALYK